MAYTDTAGLSKHEARIDLAHDLVSAILAGQIAGLVMAIVMMLVFTLFLGKGPIFPVQVIGSFIFGDSVLHGFHLPPFLAGLLLHQLGPSLFWGVVFGLAIHGLNVRHGGMLVAIGVIAGLLSQFIDANIILPPAMRALHGHDIWAEQVPAFWSWTAHLVFGLALSVFPWIHDRLAPRFHG